MRHPSYWPDLPRPCFHFGICQQCLRDLEHESKANSIHDRFITVGFLLIWHYDHVLTLLKVNAISFSPQSFERHYALPHKS